VGHTTNKVVIVTLIQTWCGGHRTSKTLEAAKNNNQMELQGDK
jgi:hypothetical protein